MASSESWWFYPLFATRHSLFAMPINRGLTIKVQAWSVQNDGPLPMAIFVASSLIHLCMVGAIAYRLVTLL
jgi:hypothetical protein